MKKGIKPKNFKEFQEKGHEAHRGKSSWNTGKTKKELPQLSNSGVKKGNIPWNKGKKGATNSGSFKSGEEHRNWKGGIPKCKICGKEVGNYLSKICKSCFKKENHPNWKGGITPEEKVIRHSLEYEVWKLEVYKKDRGVCRLCGERCNNKNIVAHHLNNFKDFPELRFSVENGIVLCRSCHKKIHWEIGFITRFNKKYE